MIYQEIWISYVIILACFISYVSTFILTERPLLPLRIDVAFNLSSGITNPYRPIDIGVD